MTEERCDPSHDLIEGWLGDSMYDAQWRPGLRVAEDGVDGAREVVDPDQQAAAARDFRDVLGRFASGVTVVTALSGGAPVGLTCQSFSSVSLNPPLVLFVPSATSRAWPLIQRAGVFTVNFLADGQQTLSNQMAGKGADKFAGVAWAPSRVTGSPLLAGTVGWVDCTIESVHPGGDHDVVIGRVVDLDVGDVEEPLLFYRGTYHSTDAGQAG